MYMDSASNIDGQMSIFDFIDHEQGEVSNGIIRLYNEDCFETMKNMKDGDIDLILTSPFYNTNKKAGKNLTLENTPKVKHGRRVWVRYDVHVDNMTDDEYCDYSVNLFNEFDRIVGQNGGVLYNINYGAENTNGMFKAVNAIITQTNFSIADVIAWKKKSALPNNCSPNRLTRIIEFVFVFCRKDEMKTFRMNKKMVSMRDNGQKMYENIFNFVEAKNNDGSCPYNKATYSTELCEKLLSMYAPDGATIYDPFMGSGTTAVACKRMGLNCIGSEISTNQVKYEIDRLKNEFFTMQDGKDLFYKLKE